MVTSEFSKGAKGLFLFGIAIGLTVLATSCNSPDKTTTDTNDGKGERAKTNDTSSPSGVSFFQRRDRTKSLLVFVHGVLGDPRETWTNASSGAFFPGLVAKDKIFDGWDIYVVGYPTPATKHAPNIDELTEGLRRELHFEQIWTDYQQVVFVCHSMGGLVTRAFLLKYRDFADKVKMIYFFSTPSTGSQLSAFGAALSKNSQFRDMINIVDNTFISNQDSSWVASPFPNQIRSYCAYEVQPTFGQSVVTRESATSLCVTRRDPINRNHMDIVKPSNATDEPYQAFVVAFREVFEPASQSIELNNANLASLIPQLENGVPLRAYVVKEPVKAYQLLRDSSQWTMFRLRFEKGGILYLGDKTLTIDIKSRLASEADVQLLFASWPSEERIAGPKPSSPPNGSDAASVGGEGTHGGHGGGGNPGIPGLNGKPGGRLLLRLHSLPGAFIVDLVGQSGGEGGDGSRGGNGSNGTKGSAGRSNLFDCAAGGGDGGVGGNGGRGGNAGLGGNCGEGGVATIAVPEDLVADATSRVHAATTTASIGSPGTPGQGGSAGAGGDGGNGSGHCGGGRAASSGTGGGGGEIPPNTRSSVCSGTKIHFEKL